MHRLSSRASLVRFRLTAVGLILTVLLALGTLVVVGMAVMQRHPGLLMIAGSVAGACLLVFLLQWSMAQRARCPLCMVPPMVRKPCSKNRAARKLFGSYRLRVATGILIRGSFRCPYCNEPTAMETREKARQVG